MGTVAIALYTMLLFAILTALAGWGLSDTNQSGDASHYNSCELEVEGKMNADNRKLFFHGGQTTVIVEDSTSYHCSFGLYTEELKYSAGPRWWHLVFDITLYIILVACSILLLIAICLYSEWLLLPWLLFMAVEIVRGFISSFFILWFSHGNLARIATGIFLLGVQVFHMSLWMLVVAKFQRIYNIKRGFIDRNFDSRVYSGRAGSSYAYSPDIRRPGDWQSEHASGMPPGHGPAHYSSQQ